MVKNLPFSESISEEDPSESGNSKRRNSNINIKNFDDFKNLLKDLKITLNMSNYSDFHENFEENFQELEISLKEYQNLDF